MWTQGGCLLNYLMTNFKLIPPPLKELFTHLPPLDRTLPFGNLVDALNFSFAFVN